MKNNSSVFSVLGAATGLGIAFRFPALVSSYGAAFILAYAAALAVCFPLLCAELTFARRGGRAGAVFKWLSRIAAVNSAVIALYYAVIVSKVGTACVGYSFGLGASPVLPAAAISVITGILLLGAYFVVRGGQRALSATGRASVVLSVITFTSLAVAALVTKGAGVFFNVDFSVLAGGSVWVDALGQALLSLSLAAGVMPAYSRSRKRFSPRRTAALIIAANFIGSVMAASATLPHVPEIGGKGGIAVALTVFPEVVNALAKGVVSRKLLGSAIFFVLTVVAVHSLASLTVPFTTVLPEKFRRYAIPLFFVISGICAPLFAANGCAALNMTDKICCSCIAVSIAAAEGGVMIFSRLNRSVKALIVKRRGESAPAKGFFGRHR